MGQLALFFLALLCGALPARAEEAEVQPHLQEIFLQKLGAVKQTAPIQAWGLFSTGGWSHQGQHMVVKTEKDALYWQIPIGKKDITERSLSPKEWQDFHGQMQRSADVQAYPAKAFDALTFEYVEISGAKPQVTRRLVFVDVGLEKVQNGKINGLIEAFLKLKKAN